MAAKKLRTLDVFDKHHKELLDEWTNELQASVAQGKASVTAGELRAQAEEFLRLLVDAVRSGGTDVENQSWTPVRKFLDELSASRVRAGFTSAQTATFIFSLKRPI